MFDKFVNDNNIFKDKMVNSTIHTAKQIINTQKSQKRGGVSMATSSITHNFVVSNPNSVKRFVAAIDEADRDRTPKQTLPGRQLTNPQEILALMSKRKKKHV